MTCLLFHLYGEIRIGICLMIFGLAARCVFLGPNADLLLFLFRFVGLWGVPFI